MTLATWGFEAGPAGNAVTADNSGLTLVSAPGGSAVYDSAQKETGALSARFTNAAGGQAVGRATAASASTTMSFSVSFRTPTTIPGTGFEVATLRHGSGRLARVQLQGNGDLLFRDLNITNDLTIATGLSAATWYRLAGWVIVGGTGQNVALNLYPVASNTPLNADPVTATAYNLGTSAFTAMDVGVVSTISTSTAVWIDNAQLSNGVTEFLPYYDPTVPQPPSVTAGADQTVAVGAAVDLTSTATDPDGSIASYQWTVWEWPANTAIPTITGATSANASFSPVATGIYVLRITVTDSDGLSAYDETTVWVPAATVRPVETIGPTDWTNVGDAPSISEALADDSDVTYVESPDIGTTTLVQRLPPMSVGTVFEVDIRAALSEAGPGAATVELLEGSTVRATWNLTPTTAIATYTLATNQAQAQSITNWNQLDLRFTWAAG